MAARSVAGRPAIAVFGGPGAGAMAAQSAARGGVTVLGFLNDGLAPGGAVSGFPVLGPFAAWRDWPAARFVAPLHKAKEMRRRCVLIDALGVPEARWTTIVDPAAIIAADATLGAGVFVGAFALVDAAARIGRHAAVFPGAQIGHDATLGDFAFVGRNAVVSGRARVGRGAHVGPGAVIRDDIAVGAFAVIGAGAVVLRDVPDGAIMLGNPARRAGGS